MGPGDEVDWLRSDLEESPVIAVKKKSLVNKLDDLARRKFMLKFNLRFLLFTEDQHHCWLLVIESDQKEVPHSYAGRSS